jgi:hypothetical protein
MGQAEAVSAAARTWVALVHHPVYDRTGGVITTAITNLDVHDIARSARTYGLAGYFVVTPIDAQRDLVGRILGHWTEHEGKRHEALGRVRVVGSIEEAVTAIGGPYVVATAARARQRSTPLQVVKNNMESTERPNLVLFGTGWGLVDEVLGGADALLPPIRSAEGGEYNHLSVRSAAAIVLDRLFGER